MHISHSFFITCAVIEEAYNLDRCFIYQLLCSQMPWIYACIHSLFIVYQADVKELWTFQRTNLKTYVPQACVRHVVFWLYFMNLNLFVHIYYMYWMSNVNIHIIHRIQRDAVHLMSSCRTVTLRKNVCWQTGELQFYSYLMSYCKGRCCQCYVNYESIKTSHI